jgi:DNA replication initiation complex subunit (GINS family)
VVPRASLERLISSFSGIAALLPEESALYEAMLEIVALFMAVRGGSMPIGQMLEKLQAMMDLAQKSLFSRDPEEQAATIEIWHLLCTVHAVLKRSQEKND